MASTPSPRSCLCLSTARQSRTGFRFNPSDAPCQSPRYCGVHGMRKFVTPEQVVISLYCTFGKTFKGQSFMVFKLYTHMFPRRLHERCGPCHQSSDLACSPHAQSVIWSLCADFFYSPWSLIPYKVFSGVHLLAQKRLTHGQTVQVLAFPVQDPT